MLEKDCIQTRGFRNTLHDGKVTGFQLNVRSLYYRGLWLSQLREATLMVDGESFAPDKIRWRINGKVYTKQEMANLSGEHWCVTDPATLLVEKPGGLEMGYHDVRFGFRFSSSYMPPAMDEVLSYGDHEKRMVLV